MTSVHATQTSEEMDFDAFVESSQADLQRAGWVLTGDWSSAEDLTQEALLRAWRRWDRLRGMSKRHAYVRKVLVTTYLSRQRRLWRNELAHGELVDVASHESTDNIDNWLYVTGLVRSLPPRQRTVLVLRYMFDYTEPEVARLMGTSLGTVKSQHAKAVRTLRTHAGLTKAG